MSSNLNMRAFKDGDRLVIVLDHPDAETEKAVMAMLVTGIEKEEHLDTPPAMKKPVISENRMQEVKPPEKHAGGEAAATVRKPAENSVPGFVKEAEAAEKAAEAVKAPAGKETAERKAPERTPERAEQPKSAEAAPQKQEILRLSDAKQYASAHINDKTLQTAVRMVYGAMSMREFLMQSPYKIAGILQRVYGVAVER